MKARHLLAVVVALASAGCSSRDWTESVLTYTGEDRGGDEILASITDRLEAALTPRGFTCDSHETMLSRGHTEWYSTCYITDVGNPLQGTTTWVKVVRPGDHGSARVQVETGHVTAHPFTPSTKYFRKWAEVVGTTLCGFEDFEVEHSWPADSEYPISC